MIDLLCLKMYFKNDQFDIIENNEGVAIGGTIEPEYLLNLGLAMSAGKIEKDEMTGETITSRLYHPFESIPSSSSSLSFKVWMGSTTYFPHIEIKASPAKLMQGHNAYGSANLKTCASALMFTFIHAYPEIADRIEHKKTIVHKLDVTYSAHLGNSFQCKQVIKALTEVSTGHSRSTQSHSSTASWNYGSDLCAKIVYLKEVEVFEQIKKITSEMKTKKHGYLQKQLDALESEPVQKFIKNCVRFEAKYRIKYFKRNDIPTNLYEMIKYSESNPNFIKRLWEEAFHPIFNAFEGNMIDLNDSEAIYKKMVEKFGVHKTVTDKNGNKKTVLVETKAKNIYSFFILLKSQGFEVVKSSLSDSAFYRKFAFLRQVIPEAQIRTLHSPTSNIVSLVSVIKVDFTRQHPPEYIEPQNVLALVS